MMIHIGTPFAKDEVLAGVVAEKTAVSAFFSNIDDDAFFAAPPQVWSPAENLVHLIKSSSPVVMALNLPQMVLRLRFGKANRASRTLAEVRTEYVEVALAGGGVAGGPFLPKVNEQSAAEKRCILEKWQEKCEALVQAIGKWSEAELDEHLLPHPLLGKMTVREILFFTLYHNMHHVNDVQRLLGLPESEWFG
ncbi:MAG: DinB family protein [Anaerolineales bacterium]|nr:DinB family protein [Anaerolineales bacterium]